MNFIGSGVRSAPAGLMSTPQGRQKEQRDHVRYEGSRAHPIVITLASAKCVNEARMWILVSLINICENPHGRLCFFPGPRGVWFRCFITKRVGFVFGGWRVPLSKLFGRRSSTAAFDSLRRGPILYKGKATVKT